MNRIRQRCVKQERPKTQTTGGPVSRREVNNASPR
jgi:hypothetical protein